MMTDLNETTNYYLTETKMAFTPILMKLFDGLLPSWKVVVLFYDTVIPVN